MMKKVNLNRDLLNHKDRPRETIFNKLQEMIELPPLFIKQLKETEPTFLSQSREFDNLSYFGPIEHKEYGFFYIGQMKSSERHGYGIYVNPRRQILQWGHAINGKYNGLGLSISPDGAVFLGSWKNSQQHKGIRWRTECNNKIIEKGLFWID